MIPDIRAVAALAGGMGLLERALNYTLGCLHIVTPEALSRATPCAEWDLRALLTHLEDSLAALHEAIDSRHVGLAPARDGRLDTRRAGQLNMRPAGDQREVTRRPADDPVAAARNGACQLIGVCTIAADAPPVVSVEGTPLTTAIVVGTGAIEVAVHGWDIARACGRHRPLPPSLAEQLLELSPLFVTAADRPARFAAPVDVPPSAGPADRLIAFLGRQPSRSAPTR